jgi:hypothetical protein
MAIETQIVNMKHITEQDRTILRDAYKTNKVFFLMHIHTIGATIAYKYNKFENFIIFIIQILF